MQRRVPPLISIICSLSFFIEHMYYASMRRIIDRIKTPIKVTAEIDHAGTITPLVVEWNNGAQWRVRVLKVEPVQGKRKSFLYIVHVGHRGGTTKILYEDGIWYAWKKVYEKEEPTYYTSGRHPHSPDYW